jgi:hypothetical protein
MIVNFAVKEAGLEAQLLAAVVKAERPDLDKQKNDLVVKVAAGKRTQVGQTFNIHTALLRPTPPSWTCSHVRCFCGDKQLRQAWL